MFGYRAYFSVYMPFSLADETPCNNDNTEASSVMSLTQVLQKFYTSAS